MFIYKLTLELFSSPISFVYNRLPEKSDVIKSLMDTEDLGKDRVRSLLSMLKEVPIPKHPGYPKCTGDVKSNSYLWQLFSEKDDSGRPLENSSVGIYLDVYWLEYIHEEK